MELLMPVSVLVPILGFLGTIMTAASVAAVAIITNRSEKKQAAETSMEKTLRERILLRDEQIADLRADLIEAREEVRTKDAEIQQLRLTQAQEKSI